jgi:protein gp37
MADGTEISWADATLNVVNGCTVVSPGCTNCYAMRLAGTRLRNHASRAGLTRDTKAGPVWTGEVRFNEAVLLQPLRWKRPRMIFWNAHGDMFHPSVPDEWIDRQFAVMALTPHHIHQVLTKRPERMRAWMQVLERGVTDWFIKADPDKLNDLFPHIATAIAHPGGPREWPLPNVWLGVSTETQHWAVQRIPHLLETVDQRRAPAWGARS